MKMRHSSGHAFEHQKRKHLLASAMALATTTTYLLAAPWTQAQTADGAINEIMVTGSFIRRSEGFTPASPMDSFSNEEFEHQAPRSVADFLTTLPYSFNTNFTAGRGVGATNGSGSINLRNLGSAATLVLQNSRRTARDAVTQASVDVNSLIPQITIDRIEILKDGASSIYGSDAVGGVANFITRSNFEGFEISAQGSMREHGDNETDYRLAALWGIQGEKTSAILSFEHFNREPFGIESYELWEDRNLGFYLSGWPAGYLLPNRDGAGQLTSESTMIADPMCDRFAEAMASGSITWQGDDYAESCRQNLPYGTSANIDESRYQTYAEIRHEFTEAFNFFGEFSYVQSGTKVVEVPGAAIRPASGQPPVMIPGYAPGNSFRAKNAAGHPLYAQSSGIQLGFDKNGDGINEFVPARDANGQVIVTGTDSAAGIPFWEDVVVAPGSRPLGLQCNLPGDPSNDANCRSWFDTTEHKVDIFRFVTGFEGSLGSNWQYETAYTYSFNNEDYNQFGPQFSMPNLRAALAGYGGGGCVNTSVDPAVSNTVPGQGGCEFFNIFGNSVISEPGAPSANTPDVLSYIHALDWQRFESKIQNYDFVLSGTAMELPAGPLGVAAGLQVRKESWSADYPSLFNAGVTDLQAAFYDTDVDQTAQAVFSEVNVPIFNNEDLGSLELSGAVRYERLKGTDLSTTDPKLGLLYSSSALPLSLRATWSTSFLAPSLYQRYRQSTAFTNSVDDYYTPEFDNLTRVTTRVEGNPDLDPQESEAYNIGFTLGEIAGFTLDLDYWNFTFEGQVSTENALQIAADPVLSLDPTKIVRDPAAGVVMHNGVNIGQIVGINAAYINTSSIETAGIDIGLSHNLDLGQAGFVSNNLLATHQTKYDVQSTPGGAVVDATDSRNDAVAGASFAIDWRWTLSTTWVVGDHSVNSLVRFTDGFENDTRANPGHIVKDRIEPYTVWDLSYNYNMELFRDTAITLSLGIKNVLDDIPPFTPDGNYTLANLFDYSGRGVWGRIKMRF